MVVIKVSTIINDTTNLFPTFTDNGGGSYTCATTSTAYAGFEQPVSDDFTVSVGQVYRVSFDYTLNSGANDLQVFIGTGGVGSSYSGSPVFSFRHWNIYQRFYNNYSSYRRCFCIANKFSF